MRDSSWLKDPLWCAKEHMRSVAHVLRTRQYATRVLDKHEKYVFQKLGEIMQKCESEVG